MLGGGGMHVGPDHPIFARRFPGREGIPQGPMPGVRFDPMAPEGMPVSLSCSASCVHMPTYLSPPCIQFYAKQVQKDLDFQSIWLNSGDHRRAGDGSGKGMETVVTVAGFWCRVLMHTTSSELGGDLATQTWSLQEGDLAILALDQASVNCDV